MHHKVDLSTLGWTLARHPLGGVSPDWNDAIPARVPGCVLDDLERAGLAPDPFYGENFRACAWAGEWTFWYRTEFCLAELGLAGKACERVSLQFDGIDTYGEIFLNGRSIGRVANQFRRHLLEVESHLRVEGKNELIVRIDPVKAGFRQWCGEVKPDAAGVTALFDDDRPWIRKAQMTFGWDNCPYLVAGGITLPIWLEVASGPALSEIGWAVSQVDVEARTAVLVLRGEVCHAGNGGTIQVVGRCGDHVFQAGHSLSQEGPWEVSIAIEQARLWWPNGHGQPALYEVEIVFRQESGGEDRSALRIGLRKIEVITEPVRRQIVDYRIGRRDPGKKATMDGGNVGPWERQPLDEPVEVEIRPFGFEVNGRRIFVKGLDWQAPDVLVGRITDEKLRRIVDAARDAHCNMLRAWGGGAVEREAFYERCDEAGILLWQDFFFACAIYPRDPRFLAETQIEAADIVRRLRCHTCVAAWCGDNESDMIEHDLGRDPALNPINKRILLDAVRAHDPQQRYYHPSSPSGGPYPRSDFGGDKRNWGSRFPHRNYWHIRQEEARFISESGSKALPSLATIRRSIPEGRQWPMDNLTWKLHAGDLDLRVRGDYRNEGPCTAFFKTPGNLEEAVIVSQFAQAWGMKLLIEQCRRRKGECGGILIWKTADQWPAYDHGVFDYFGHPRIYAAWIKEAFRPVAPSITQDRGDPAGANLELWLSNDHPHAVAGELRFAALQIAPDGSILGERALSATRVELKADGIERIGSFCVAEFGAEDTLFRTQFTGEVAADTVVQTYAIDPQVAYRYHMLGRR